jgi:hypothetical protein
LFAIPQIETWNWWEWNNGYQKLGSAGGVVAIWWIDGTLSLKSVLLHNRVNIVTSNVLHSSKWL